MKVKTSTLIPPALDWAVAKAEGITLHDFGRGAFEAWVKDALTGEDDYLAFYRPSTDWAQGGPIIERELIDIQAKFNSGSNIVPKGQWYWQASTVNEDDVAYWLDGPTPLIAAMRCHVASRLGDEVDVPEELL